MEGNESSGTENNSKDNSGSSSGSHEVKDFMEVLRALKAECPSCQFMTSSGQSCRTVPEDESAATPSGRRRWLRTCESWRQIFKASMGSEPELVHSEQDTRRDVLSVGSSPVYVDEGPGKSSGDWQDPEDEDELINNDSGDGAPAQVPTPEERQRRHQARQRSLEQRNHPSEKLQSQEQLQRRKQQQRQQQQQQQQQQSWAMQQQHHWQQQQQRQWQQQQHVRQQRDQPDHRVNTEQSSSSSNMGTPAPVNPRRFGPGSESFFDTFRRFDAIIHEKMKRHADTLQVWFGKREDFGGTQPRKSPTYPAASSTKKEDGEQAERQ